MQISLHLGSLLTDEDRVYECLRANRAALAQVGIVVPKRKHARHPLRNAAAQTPDQPLDAQMRTDLVARLCDPAQTTRLVLSWDAYLGGAQAVVRNGRLYPKAASRLRGYREMFAGHDLRVHLALRNPATLLAALAGKLGGKKGRALLASVDVTSLSWRNTVAQMRAACPDVPLTIWCDEDTPFIWHTIMQTVSGHPPDMQLDGLHNWYSSVMTDAGVAAMQAWLQSHPPATEDQRSRIIGAFLDKFHDSGRTEIDMAGTGWSDDVLDLVTTMYEQDFDAVAQMEGVSVLRA